MLKKWLFRHPGITSFVFRRMRKAGFDIIQGPNPAIALLLNYKINVLLDVGANRGQYAMRTRALGYRGRTHSFEPLAAAHAELKRNAQRDPLWSVHQFGLGDYDGEATINVSENSTFSSILNAAPLLAKEYYGSRYVATEKIDVRRLDSILGDCRQAGDRVFLKIDTQGFEKQVLDGAKDSLKEICGIQIELSFARHYEQEVLMKEMVDRLDQEGFTLVSLAPLDHNLQTGKLFQADGMFMRLGSPA